MRHRKRGRILGRSPTHRRAMLRNLASALILTEHEDELADNKPKVKGRVITTLHKAKEVRPLVEKCITMARKALVHEASAKQFGTDAARNTDAWKEWRKSAKWKQWADAMAPSLSARRYCLRLLGDKQAVKTLFSDVAPRFADRNGGYTRILRLSKTRLGDAGVRAMLEFVGVHDRVVQRSEKPSFSDEAAPAKAE